jgi:hypothetical protein
MAERGVLIALNGLLKGINSGLDRRSQREEQAKERALKEREFTLREENQKSKDAYYEARITDQENRTAILADKLGVEKKKTDATITDKTDENYASLTAKYTDLQNQISKEDDKLKELMEDRGVYGDEPKEKNKKKAKDLDDLIESRKKRKIELEQEAKNVDLQKQKHQRKAPKGQKTSASKIKSFEAVKTLQMIDSLDEPDDILNALDENDFSLHNAEEREELKKYALQKILGGRKVAAAEYNQGPKEAMPSTGKFYEDAQSEIDHTIDSIKFDKPGKRRA